MIEKKSNIGVMASIVFIVLVGLGFVSMWYFSNPATISSVSSSVGIDLTGTKAEAEKTLQNRDNLSGMPVAAPADSSIGKTNPFQ